MLRSFTFGCGQGATKAMITAIDNDVLDKSRCVVVNSTIKDVPSEYRPTAIIISDDPDAGCGKVRDAARALMNDFIKVNPNYLEEQAQEIKTQLISLIDSVAEASENLLEKLHEDDIMDISTDIKMLQTTLASKGLLDSDFDL